MLHLNQLKKIENAHAAGKAFTMRMDPFQATQHGSGIWGDIASKLKGFVKKHNLQDVVNPIIKGTKKKLHSGLSNLHKLGHETIEKIQPIGQGIKKKRGRKPKSATTEGTGIIGDVLSGLIHLTGVGVKKTRKPRTKKWGKGILSNIAKSAVKALAPVIIDKGSELLKIKISGTGTHKKRGRPKGSKGKNASRS